MTSNSEIRFLSIQTENLLGIDIRKKAIHTIKKPACLSGDYDNVMWGKYETTK